MSRQIMKGPLVCEQVCGPLSHVQGKVFVRARLVQDLDELPIDGRASQHRTTVTQKSLLAEPLLEAFVLNRAANEGRSAANKPAQ